MCGLWWWFHPKHFDLSHIFCLTHPGTLWFRNLPEESLFENTFCKEQGIIEQTSGLSLRGKCRWWHSRLPFCVGPTRTPFTALNRTRLWCDWKATHSPGSIVKTVCRQQFVTLSRRYAVHCLRPSGIIGNTTPLPSPLLLYFILHDEINLIISVTPSVILYCSSWQLLQYEKVIKEVLEIK